MHELYEYRIIQAKAHTWRHVIDQIAQGGASATAEAGGTLYGLWVGQIGLASDEGVIMTVWPDDESRVRSGSLIVQDIEEVVGSQTERLVATVRPAEPRLSRKAGICAHRWFELKEADWPEFVALSEAAWPDFEKSFDSEILGFWRSQDVQAPQARVLLLTRYPDLATWERSRIPNLREGAEAEVAKRFLRRQQLTESTIVRITQLMLPAPEGNY